ncbi:hypothetical protein [Rhizobium leguminosarum]|nr:hypothetical protein [Rhizobium leguminosarum]
MAAFREKLPLTGLVAFATELRIFVGLADVLGGDDMGECNGAIDDR